MNFRLRLDWSFSDVGPMYNESIDSERKGVVTSLLTSPDHSWVTQSLLSATDTPTPTLTNIPPC